MLKQGTIITCPACGKHLYKLTHDIDLKDKFEANDFEAIGDMPEPRDKELPAKCNKCGTGWTFTKVGGTRIHTEKGWWPE